MAERGSGKIVQLAPEAIREWVFAVETEPNRSAQMTKLTIPKIVTTRVGRASCVVKFRRKMRIQSNAVRFCVERDGCLARNSVEKPCLEGNHTFQGVAPMNRSWSPDSKVSIITGQ